MESFEYQQIRREIDLGVKKGWDAAQAEWKEAALQVLVNVAVENRIFSANLLTQKIKALPEKTKDNRAIAGVIAAGRRLGWIEPTGMTELSKAGHFSHVQIWRSKIFGKQVVAPKEAQQRLL